MDFERMRHDSPYREFPLLVPQFPDNLADLAALQRTWPLLRGDLVRSRLHYEAVMSAPRKKRRRAFVEYYCDTYHFPANVTYDRLYERFVGFVRLADRFIRDLVQMYFRKESWQKLFLGRRVTDDPIELLKRCFERGTDKDSQRRSFEARRKLILAQLLYEISLAHREDLLEHDQRLLSELFDKSFFTGRSEERMVRSIHDPFREFQTVGIVDEPKAPPGMRLIEKPLTFRFFRSFGEELPVYFEIGVKTSFSLLEKMLRKGIRDPFEIKDLRRYLLVFRNEWEMRRGLRVLRERVHNAAGVIHDHASNIFTDGPADGNNPHSNPTYRQKKFVVVLDGRRFEGMVQVLPDFLDGKYATNGKNHAVYKLDQRLSSTFPILLPSEICSRRWDDPAIREELRSDIYAENHKVFGENAR